MNTKPLISTLLGLSVLASAQIVPKVPVLSEPRSISVNTLSMDAWGDTLIASRMGSSYRIVRKGDQVVMIDSINSDSLRAERPRTLPVGDGTYLQASHDWIAGLDWSKHAAGTAIPNVVLGYSRAEGDLFRKPGNDTLFGLLCSPMTSVVVKRLADGSWIQGTNLPVDGSGVEQHCAVDRMNGLGYRFFYGKNTDSSKLQSGDATTMLLSASVQTLPIKPTSVFANANGWLAYDDVTGKIMIRHDSYVDLEGKSVRVTMRDTVFQPVVLSQLNDDYVSPVNKDSLIVFGGDSTLVLAGWTRDQFQVYQTIKLDDKVYHAMALGDSVLWVQTYNKVLSFRIRWESRSTSAKRNLERISSLRIQQATGTVSFHWTGRQETPIEVRKADGSIFFSSRIPQDGHVNMTTKSYAGTLFVRTTDGTKSLMVTK